MRGSILAGVVATGLVSTLVTAESGESFMSANGFRNMEEKITSWEHIGKTRKYRPSIRKQEAVCTDGVAVVDGEDFPCENIDFLSFISLDDSNIPSRFDGSDTATGSDIWGWLSPSGREITLFCVDSGIWFVDGTDPVNPQQLGFMASERPRRLWADVKVINNTAYIVKDGSGGQDDYGVQVFDLLRLEGLDADPTREFEPDYDYMGHGSSHNIVSDTESGFLYSVGTRTCRGGLHVLDVNQDRLEPTFVGCYSDDRYTHDAQCVVYRGPDSRYTGSQICLGFNEDTLSIIDVTDKQNMTMIGRGGYSTFKYTHQGWFTADFRYVLLNDEIDERERPEVTNTTTYIFDVQDLTNPVLVDTFVHEDISIDHNLYIWGAIHENGWAGNGPLPEAELPNRNYVYLSNYIAGIKVLDVTDITNVQNIGKFDIAPDTNSVLIYEGTWSNYMHPSGVLAVSTFERGLFLLRPNMAFDEEVVLTDPPGGPTSFPTVAIYTPPAIPDAWGCRTRYFEDTVLCDCGCGAYDPDCDVEGLDVRVNCGAGTECSADLTVCVEIVQTDAPTNSPVTETPTTSPTPVPVETSSPTPEPVETSSPTVGTVETSSPTDATVDTTGPTSVDTGDDDDDGEVSILLWVVFGVCVLAILVLLGVIRKL